MDFGLLWTENDSWLSTGPPTKDPLRLIKHFFDDVLLEYDGLTFVLPPAVHLDFFVLIRLIVHSMSHKILETAQSPNSPIPLFV